MVSGRVFDPAGLTLPGATVVVTNEATGFTREAVTAENGAYWCPISSRAPTRSR
ncbi:MAG: carboxypeptidase-like regulatory domain-containing protein [Vicinamibacterales bacterium]